MADKISKFFRRFFLINDSPHKVAAGAALGIFLGIFPGAGLAAALILSSFFRFNRLAAASGALAVNTWSTLFVLPLAAQAGSWMFEVDAAALQTSFNKEAALSWSGWLTNLFFSDIALPLIIGFLAINGLIALTAYFAIIFLIKFFKPRDTHLLRHGN